MEDEKNENPVTPQQEEKSEKELLDEMGKTFLEELKSNPKYKPFFEQFNSSSVQTFQDTWAREKARLYVWKKYYTSQAEIIHTEYMETAKEKLWEIQQRKFFDLQCRWRANQVEVPDLLTTIDIKYWEAHIEKCPFLSPISTEELERYISFIENSNWEDAIEFTYYEEDWQDYDDFKEYYFGNKDVFHEPSPWYEYYETVTGLSSLYHLPDNKTPNEDKYTECYRDFERRNKKEEPAKPYESDNRPVLWSFENNNLENFIEKYEDNNTIYLYRCAEKVKSGYLDRDLEEAIKVLKLAEEKIYLSSAKEWNTSIIDASHEYVKKRLVQDLPGAYKSYMFRIENKIPFEEDESRHDQWLDEYRMKYREEILKGRELMGEPRDFNY
jgi:hypothetical protein